MQAIRLADTYITRLAEVFDSPSIDYEQIVIVATIAQTVFEVYLLRRQIRALGAPLPPPSLKPHFSQETYVKARSYSLAKARYSLIKTLFDQALGYYMIRAHLYPRLWEWTGARLAAAGVGRNATITHSLGFITVLTLLSSIPSIPWSYYYTFVLEEAHGFNKSTVRLWVTDQLKTYALIAALGLPFMAGFLWIINWAGKAFVPFLMVFIVAIQLILQIVYPTFIQPLFNKLEPLPEGDLRTRVNSLAAKLRFPLKHLYVIDGSKRSSHSNAYFYGLPWSKHIVIYDTLIDKSSPAEVEAVLGHELGHWYFSHPTKLLLVAQSHLFITLTAFSIFIHNTALFKAFHFDPRLATSNPYGGAQPIVIGFMLYQLISGPLDAFVQVMLNFQTRKYEYQADEFSVQLGQKKELGSALIKLHVQNLSAPHNDKFYSMYHHSHPTLPERLKAMEEYKPGKSVLPNAKKDL